MMNLTNRAKNHFLNFFTKRNDEDVIKEFCKAEYKNDWYAAYLSFKEEGKFPNFKRRTV